MMRFVLAGALICSLCPPAAAVPFHRPRIVTTKGKGAHAIRVILVRKTNSRLSRRSLPYTHEPLTLTVAPPQKNRLDESNIFGTGLTLDLDGDGKTTNTLPFRCIAGSAKIGKLLLHPVGLNPMQYLHGKKARRFKAGRLPGGAGLLLYRPCQAGKPLTLGIHPGRPIRLARTAGPTLVLTLLEPRPAPRGRLARRLRTLRVNGRPSPQPQHALHVYERIRRGGPEWFAARLVMVPLPHKAQRIIIRAELRSPSKDSLVVANVNDSSRRGERRRGPFSLARLGGHSH